MRSRNSGPRSNAWSQSKLTNQTPFDPQSEEIGRVYDLYRDEWSDSSQTIYRQMPLNPKFLMPVTLAEVMEETSKIPTRYTEGLKAVVILGGSEKQNKASTLFAFGRYISWNVIVLHAFPRSMLKSKSKRGMRPDVQTEYARAGAIVTKKNGMQVVEFTPRALRDFYLYDVLMHEIGHHVDRANREAKPLRKREGFAEWFASEFGFRLRG